VRAGAVDDPLPAQVAGLICGPGQQGGRATIVGVDGEFGQYRSGGTEHGGGMGVGVRVDADDDINLFCQDRHCGCSLR